MKKIIEEDWLFQISVLSAEPCRIGLEKGDTFTCEYTCPADFCPKTMSTLHTLCEIVRCGGNYKLKGSMEEYEIDFPCADGCVMFHLKAIKHE